jgi:tripartite-type tricarboxylate transporter receptor subunit TctC
MTLNRRKTLGRFATSLLAATGALALSPAVAQNFPTKPIHIVVPTPAGSGADIDIRKMSVHLGDILGQPIIIENRPGAATRIAIDYVAKAPPDGYTLLVGTPTMTTAHFLYSKLPFDVKRDLVPVGLASVTNVALTINADVPAKTLGEYIALAKSDPKYADFGTIGPGATNHLTAAWFGSLTGVQTRYIHFNTAGPTVALAAGQIPATFEAILPVLQLRKAGKLRTLAISGTKRNPLMPDVPTFAEAGLPDLQPLVWIGLMAPTGTPPDIVKKLSAALAKVAKMQETVDFRISVGSESVGSTPEEFATFLDAERDKWGDIIKKLGLKLD